MSERIHSAPSPMDNNPTDKIPQAGTTPDGEPTSVNEVEAVYNSINIDELQTNDYNGIAYTYEVAKQLPDVSVSLQTALERIVDDRQATVARVGAENTLPTPLSYMQDLHVLGQAEIGLSKKHHDLRVFSPESADNPQAKALEIIQFIDEQLPAIASEDDKRQIEQDKQILADFSSSENRQKMEQARQTLPVEYYDHAATLFHEEPNDEQKNELHRLRSATHQLIEEEFKEAEALDLIHAYLPKIEQTSATLADPETLKDAREQLDNLRAEIAQLNAKREKRMWGVDSVKGDSRASYKNKALYEKYHQASREVFELENPNIIKDDSLSTAEKIKKIAEYTVDEAKKLDEAILENYKNTKTLFGKKIEQYGNLSKSKKIIAGIGLSALAGVLTGGMFTFAVSGSLMAATFEAERRKKRAAGDSMLDLNYEQITSKYKYKNLNTKNMNSMFDGINAQTKSAFEDRITKEQNKRLFKTIGSYAAGATIGAVTHHLPGSLLDGINLNDSVHATPDGGSFSGDIGAHGTTTGDFGQTMPGSDELKGGWLNPNAPVYSPDVSGGGDFPTWGNPDVSMTGGEFAPDTFYVHNGEGFYDVLKNMGVESWQRDDILAKAGQELIDKGFAYQMEDGMPGIPRVGELPQGAIDILVKAAGK